MAEIRAKHVVDEPSRSAPLIATVAITEERPIPSQKQTDGDNTPPTLLGAQEQEGGDMVKLSPRQLVLKAKKSISRQQQLQKGKGRVFRAMS